MKWSRRLKGSNPDADSLDLDGEGPKLRSEIVRPWVDVRVSW